MDPLKVPSRAGGAADDLMEFDWQWIDDWLDGSIQNPQQVRKRRKLDFPAALLS